MSQSFPGSDGGYVTPPSVEGGERDSSSYGNSCRFAREERKEEARKSMNGMSRTRLRWAVRRPSVYAARLRARA